MFVGEAAPCCGLCVHPTTASVVYGYLITVLTKQGRVCRTLHAKNCTGLSDSLATALKRHAVEALDSWQPTSDSSQLHPKGVTVLPYTIHIDSIGPSGLL